MDREVLPQALLKAVASGGLTERQAGVLFRRGEEGVVLATLELTRRLALARGASSELPSVPLSTIPTYAKPAAQPRCERPGARPRHPGRWPAPDRTLQRRGHARHRPARRHHHRPLATAVPCRKYLSIPNG